MPDPFGAQREEDAAYFEDWTEWRHLALLDSFRGMIELRPQCASSVDIITHLPDAQPYRHHRYDPTRCYLVPVRHWRAVRAVLPRVGAIDAAYRKRLEEEETRRRVAAVASRYRLGVGTSPQGPTWTARLSSRDPEAIAALRAAGAIWIPNDLCWSVPQSGRRRDEMAAILRAACNRELSRRGLPNV